MIALFGEWVRNAPGWLFGILLLLAGTAWAAAAHFVVAWLYRSRLVADMPTAKLRSAAQGYTELEGRAAMIPGEPIYAPLSGMPCVWYRYSVEQTRRDNAGSNDWGVVEAGVSEAIFHLLDDSGACIVDPDGAEVIPSVKLCWRGDEPRPLHAPKATGPWSRLFSFGAYRYTEWRIHEHDPLYAVGHYQGIGDVGASSLGEATRDLLAVWKRDKAVLLRRFDRDGNGEIDQDEWEIARQEAEREALTGLGERRRQPEMSLLKKPSHGRPYILSCVSQERIIAVYRLKVLAGALGFLACALLLAWLVQQRLGPAGGG